MDHQEALTSQAVERYQLGELSPAERDAFEQHYFGCPDCAAAVYSAAVFAANARSVFVEDARRAEPARPQRWLRGWRPRDFSLAFATGLLLFIVSFEEIVRVPGLRMELARVTAPHAYPSFVLHPVARGDGQSFEVARTAPFVGLTLDLVPGEYTTLECEVRAESGATFTIPAQAPASPGAPLNLLIPTSSLEPARYTLTLRGSDSGHPSAELGRFFFNLKFN
jgi:hypothetical protein